MRRHRAAVAGMGCILVAGAAIAQAPGPPSPAAAEPGRVVPHAVLTGLYESVPDDGRGPAAETVIGKVLLDATASQTEKPIRWRWSGPSLIMIAHPSAAGASNGTAVAYLGAPGSYRFLAVARGHDAGGEPDADAALWACVVNGPTPARPQPAPVQPQPQPTPQPERRPFPER